jgi:hypothetical protein
VVVLAVVFRIPAACTVAVVSPGLGVMRYEPPINAAFPVDAQSGAQTNRKQVAINVRQAFLKVII